MGPPPLPADGDDAAEDALRGEAQDPGPQVGDLAILPVPRVRQQVGCGERVGIVLEDRRNVVKVFFPEIDRAFWIDRGAVQPVREGRLPADPLALRLHRVCRIVDAVAVEIYDREADAEVFHVYTRGTSLDRLNEVRSLIGEDFRRLEVEPGGVRRARLTLVFRTARGSAAEGDAAGR